MMHKFFSNLMDHFRVIGALKAQYEMLKANVLYELYKLFLSAQVCIGLESHVIQIS